MYCPYCGNQNDDNNKYCWSCGRLLVPENKELKPDKTKFLFALILIAVIVILFIWLVILKMQSGKPDTAEVNIEAETESHQLSDESKGDSNKPAETLKTFAEGKQYSKDNTYIGYTEYHGEVIYDFSNVPIGPVDYKICDFDKDGDPELLMISLTEEFGIQLNMFEYENGVVLESAEKIYKNIKLSECTAMGGGNPGRLSFFTYGTDNIYIGIEKHSGDNLSTDALEVGFAVTQYDGNQFEEVAYYRLSGFIDKNDLQDESDDEDAKKEIEKTNIPISYADLLSGRLKMADVAEGSQIINTIVVESLIKEEEYENTNDYVGFFSHRKGFQVIIGKTAFLTSRYWLYSNDLFGLSAIKFNDDGTFVFFDCDGKEDFDSEKFYAVDSLRIKTQMDNSEKEVNVTGAWSLQENMLKLHLDNKTSEEIKSDTMYSLTPMTEFDYKSTNLESDFYNNVDYVYSNIEEEYGSDAEILPCRSLIPFSKIGDIKVQDSSNLIEDEASQQPDLTGIWISEDMKYDMSYLLILEKDGSCTYDYLSVPLFDDRVVPSTGDGIFYKGDASLDNNTENSNYVLKIDLYYPGYVEEENRSYEANWAITAITDQSFQVCELGGNPIEGAGKLLTFYKGEETDEEDGGVYRILPSIETPYDAFYPDEDEILAIFEKNVSEKLNVRCEPNHKSDLMGSISTDESLYYYGDIGYGLGSDGIMHDWYYIESESGIYGWVRSDLVKRKK